MLQPSRNSSSLSHCVSLVALLFFLSSCQVLNVADLVNFQSSSSTLGASVEVTHLRCEYLHNPLGIDVTHPRMSWQLKPVDQKKRGQKQTAYQILVASRPQLLERNQGDLWDSGEVESDQSVHVVYQGTPLRSQMECYWKVRVRDEQGVLSNWSQTAKWSMGLLAPSDWKAKWIGIDQEFVRQQGWPPPDNTIPDPWFRKKIQLETSPQRALIYVASVGYHELYINGQKVGEDILSPSVATHRKRCRYVTYDITEYLRPGDNVIGIWLGLSWSIFPHYKRNDKPQSPIVMAQAEIELPQKKTIRIVTDSSWKTHPSPNTLLGVWDFMHYGGEHYNANNEVPNWCLPDLDDSDWKAVRVYSPQLEISAEMVEPNRILKKIEPLLIQKVADQEYRIDMGTNFTGWLEMDLKGNPGQRIEFQFSERKDQPMTHRLHSAYTIGPKGTGTFRNRFNYFTGRWIQVKGLDYQPEMDDIRGYLVRTAYQRSGEFHCSNPLLNRIYDATLWTFENLSLGGYVVDCPHRERMGYGGDAHATIETALNNYNLGAFYTKWSQDWRDVQQEDGNLPYTAPTYWGGGGPAWSGFCITLPWEVYRQYGDVRILEQNFSTMTRWLEFLETQARDNMLVRWGGEWDFLGDWLWPGAKGTNGDTPETLFFNNCYWIYNLQTAAKIADILNRKELAVNYRTRAEQIRQAVHAAFYNPQDHSYANGFQAYLAIAQLVDLPPENLKEKVWKRLQDEILVHRKGHIHAGITGGAMLYKTLLQYDKQDWLYTMANKEDYPGWGNMLTKGATTLWEAWDGRNSLCHSSYLFIGTWFIKGLGGIQPDSIVPGFKQFVIKPPVLNGNPLQEVNCKYDSIYGTIENHWKWNNNTFSCQLRIPPNTTATLYMPGHNPETIRENGKELGQVAGVQFIGKNAPYLLYRLDPGEYSFTSG